MNSALTEEPKQALSFTALPPEIRLQIYGLILRPTKHTLRRQKDYGLHTKTKLFETSLLVISEKFNAETVPIL